MSHAVNSIGEPIDLEHDIHIQRSDKHVEVEFFGEVIAHSHNTLVLKEANCADVYYFPIVDVRMEFLTPTGTSSHCPYKGDASYWSIRTAQKELIDAAWSYSHPLKGCSLIIEGYTPDEAIHLLKSNVLAAPDCRPVPGAMIAHWQAGEKGRYVDHLRAWLISNEDGGYRFETEWPATRTPHIHFTVTAEGYRPLTTQWVGDEPVGRVEFDIILSPK
ncbi:MAG: DUF427 domain-containing protein [Pseudomonadota bacterium]|nr:DUF427 domain-containing protein [Pseudomonadota bacterium]